MARLDDPNCRFLFIFPPLFVRFLYAIGGCGSVSRVELRGFGLKARVKAFTARTTPLSQILILQILVLLLLKVLVLVFE